MATSYIYHLVDIGTGEVRYVGRTTNPERRMYLHLQERQIINGEETYKQRWLDWHMKKYGQPPRMVIVDSCFDIRRYKKAGPLEQEHIKAALDNGNRLLNYEILKKAQRKNVDIKKWTSFP